MPEEGIISKDIIPSKFCKVVGSGHSTVLKTNIFEPKETISIGFKYPSLSKEIESFKTFNSKG